MAFENNVTYTQKIKMPTEKKKLAKNDKFSLPLFYNNDFSNSDTVSDETIFDKDLKTFSFIEDVWKINIEIFFDVKSLNLCATQ